MAESQSHSTDAMAVAASRARRPPHPRTDGDFGRGGGEFFDAATSSHGAFKRRASSSRMKIALMAASAAVLAGRAAATPVFASNLRGRSDDVRLSIPSTSPGLGRTLRSEGVVHGGASPSSSAIFHQEADRTDPSLESNRDELIDIPAAVATPLTYSPTSAPKGSAGVAAAPPAFSGPGPFQHPPDPVPSGRGSPHEDSFFGGGGSYGSFGSYGGAPSPSHSYGGRGSGDYNMRDETDFKEFIAFVGWYAFLIFCCLLPTVCAYYRRRRNVRAMRENFLNIQGRLAEIERVRAEEIVREGEGGGSASGGGLSLEGENRDRDWEFIEQLFRSPSRGSAGSDADEVGSRHAHTILADILGGMSVRLLVERERRRRRERGRRLVAALKETSLAVRECHLIADGGESTDKLPSKWCVGFTVDEDVEGDIEMRRAAATLDARGDDDGADTAGAKGHGADGKRDVLGAGEEENRESVSKGNRDIEPGDQNESATSNEGKPRTAAMDLPSDDQVQACSTPQSTPQDNPRDGNNPALAENSVPAEAPPLADPITSSLYASDLETYGDDTEDDGYTALRLPCPATADPRAVAAGDTRLVPATCAICLLPYRPGCYVSWSSNPNCRHAFHRDCILMWLLKKEEPLCPCCRGEFVPESVLNGDSDSDEGYIHGGRGSGNYAGNAGIETNDAGGEDRINNAAGETGDDGGGGNEEAENDDGGEEAGIDDTGVGDRLLSASEARAVSHSRRHVPGLPAHRSGPRLYSHGTQQGESVQFGMDPA